MATWMDSKNLTHSVRNAGDMLYDLCCTPCARKKFNKEAAKYCTSCKQYFCVDCVVNHDSLLTGHILVDAIQHSSKGPGQKIKAMPIELCKLHHLEVVNMYCGDHDAVGCSVCFRIMGNIHQSCGDIHYVPDLVQSNFPTQEVKQINHDLTTAIKSMKTLQTQHDRMESNLDDSKATCKQEIQKYRDDINYIIDKIEADTLADLEARYREAKKATGDTAQNIKETRDELIRFKAEIESDQSNDSQKFVIAKLGQYMIKRGQELLSKLPNHQNSEIKFSKNTEIMTFLLNVLTFGILNGPQKQDCSQPTPSVSSQQQATSTASSQQLATSTASSQQLAASTASNQPQTTSTASSQQLTASTASSQQLATSTASSQPQTTSTASSQQLTTSTASSQQQTISTASSQPQATSTASSQQQQTSTSSCQKQTSVASSQKQATSTASSRQQAISSAISQQQATSTASSQHQQTSTSIHQPTKHSSASGYSRYNTQVPTQQQVTKPVLKPLKQQLYTVVDKSEYNIQQPDDKNTCSIGSSCMLDSGSILLADYNNYKLKLVDSRKYTLFSRKYTIKSSVVVKARPLSVCRSSSTEVAVCLDDRTIQFISTCNDKLVPGRTYHMDHGCEGIAVISDKLYVGGGRSLYVYTLQGKLLQTICNDTTGARIFSSIRDIAVCPDGKSLHVADYNKGVITINTTGSGSVVWCYHSEVLSGAWGFLRSEWYDFRGPQWLYHGEVLMRARGVCTDSDGHVIVCGWYSHNIMHFDPEGQCLGEIATCSDGLICPLSVCYNTTNNTLIVGQRSNNNITVFTVK